MPSPAPRDALAAHRIFIGSITPSGNTIVERLTLAILREFPQVSAHFSRTPVYGSVDPFPDAYDTDGMLAAARLLAHAAPDVLIWNGSKGGSIDFRLDHDFVAQVKAATGIACTTSTLALDEVLKQTGVTRYALVSPYDAGYQDKIIKTFPEVANNYQCEKSFRGSMQHLDKSLRNIADAHLHIQIRSSEVLPTGPQVDFRADLDVLLGEVVRVLK